MKRERVRYWGGGGGGGGECDTQPLSRIFCSFSIKTLGGGGGGGGVATHNH